MSSLEKYGITETGKEKSENSDGNGALRYRIINHIAEKGEATIPEIADAVNEQMPVVKQMVRELIREEWMTKAGMGDWD
jgi:DNA-binding MarR family transcriptional regulator